MTKHTTHLIAEQAGGAKYDEALKHSHSIQIVSPNWLESCHKAQKRLPTKNFLIVASKAGAAKEDGTKEGQAEDPHKSLLEECEQLLKPGNLPPNPLFSGLCFYWVGFDEDDDAGEHGISTQALKQQLARLVRRGMGTIV